MKKLILLLFLFFSSCAVTNEAQVYFLDVESSIGIIEADKNLPFVEIEIGDKTLTALVDTGFSGTLLLPASYIDSNNVKWHLELNEFNHPIDGSYRSSYTYLIPSLKIGQAVISNVSAYRYPKKDYAIIGLGLLTNFNLLFDLSDEKIFLYSVDKNFETEAENIYFELSPYINISADTSEMGRLSLIFDTGAYWTINDENYSILCLYSENIYSNFSDEKRNRVSSFSPDNSLNDFIILKSLGLYFSEEVNYEMDFVVLPYGWKEFDGVMGLNSFKNKRVFIDFKLNKITIDSKE